jgi:hypothetical protein
MWRWETLIFRLFIFLTGFGLAVVGGVSTIAYLNLITTGHNFGEYLSFISRRAECYMLPLGVLLFAVSVYSPAGKRYR